MEISENGNDSPYENLILCCTIKNISKDNLIEKLLFKNEVDLLLN